MQVTGSKKQENVDFSDQMDPYMYDVESNADSTRRLQDTNDATLDNFFKRPIKIYEGEWGTGTILSANFDPWSLYFDNPRVANRIANYNLLRADLHLKIVINGNGFQYGRAIVSYLPWDVFDSLTTLSAGVQNDIVQATQLPHVYLDPTTSTGGEMKLPFFNDYNYCHIPTSQWSQLGQIYLRTINTLKHANGATDKVTISVFAWTENISLNVLTGVEPDTMVPQSGSEVDEANAKGIVSGPATAIAKAAGALKAMPYIGPYATATEKVATATASVAKAFGYCKPAVTKAPEPFRPNPVSTLAVTNVPDNSQKLTVDDKQELSIDPRIAGLGSMDCLNIKSIAKRESYLTQFSWNVGTAPETLLWNGRIDPVTWAETAGPPVAFHFPATAMATLPFKYWTGTMKFRFQVVCSNFHKGRLKVVYDPNWLAVNEYNTNYLKIIDISEEQDFTIEVGNGQDKTLLDHHYPGLDSVTQMYGTTRFLSREEGNGVLGVYIVNELTVPNSTVNNDIQINVYVSMGDDFEVFVPDDHFQNFVFKPQEGFEAQAGAEIVPDAQNTQEPSAPIQDNPMSLGPTEQNTELVNKVFTGESIQSFRTMLKRFALHTTIGSGSAGNQVMYGERPLMPYLRGNVTGAVNTTGALAAYSYCNTLLLHWVTYAFSGWRGGIRYKFLPRGNHTDAFTINISRGTKGGSGYSQNRIAQPSYTSQSIAASSAVKGLSIFSDGGTKGTTYTVASVNPILEVEIPYYSDTRFTPGKTQDLTTTAVFNETWKYAIGRLNGQDMVVDIYAAAAEDYQAYFFSGLPRMYYEATPPLP